MDNATECSGNSPASGTESIHRRGTETILFVEDEDSLRNVVSDFLRELGYQVLSAAAGREALALSAGHPGVIDVLITDVTMSPLPGPELARQLRSSRPEIKVIYISGYSEALLSDQCRLDSNAALLQKPFTIKLLSARLREMLDKK